MNIFDFLNAFVWKKFLEENKESTELRCQTCQLSWFEYLQVKQRLGCPDCWIYFREQLRQIAHEVHAAAKHCGKVPPHGIAVDIDLLMKEAINKENYEEAARLRDRKKQLDKPKGN